MTAPIDLERVALLTIDIQNDTLDGGPLEVPGTSAMVPNVAALCRAFRSLERPIVHVVRLYLPDGSNAEACRQELVTGPTPILRPGTPGRALAPGVLDEGTPDLDDELLLGGGIHQVAAGEVVMYKPRWGAFFGTPLEEHLCSLHVSSLVVAGCNFANCPRTSIYEASERDFEVMVADDAISGLYDRGRDELKNIGVTFAPTAFIVRWLRAREPADALEGQQQS